MRAHNSDCGQLSVTSTKSPVRKAVGQAASLSIVSKILAKGRTGQAGSLSYGFSDRLLVDDDAELPAVRIVSAHEQSS